MSDPRILVAGLDSGLAARITPILRQRVKSVTVAGAGGDALDLLGKEPAAILICELRQGEQSGLSLWTDARRLCPDLQAILLASRPSVEDAVEALRSGVTDLVIKPISEAAILSAIDRALARLTRRPMNKVESPQADDIHLPPAPHFLSPRPETPNRSELTIDVSAGGSLHELERRLVEEVIRRFDGNKSAAARSLGIHRKSLYRLLAAKG